MYASAVTGIKIMRLNYYFYCIICVVHIFNVVCIVLNDNPIWTNNGIGKKVRDDNKRKNN